MGRAGIGVFVVLALAAAQANLLRFPLGESVDRLIHDLRLRMVTAPADPRIVIVDIDENSLAELGRWPWERGVLAKLIANLTDKAGAAVVGVDIVFAESQREAGQDDALAAAIASRPVALGYYFTSDRGGRTSGALPQAVMRAESLPHGVRPLSWDGYGASIEPLQRAARGAGFFNPVIDPDGVVRALPLLGEYRGGLYESLSVAVLRQYLGGAALGVTQDHLVLQGSRGTVRIPFSTGLTALVPFSSAPADEDAAPAFSRVGSTSGRFRYVSAADVIAGRGDPARVPRPDRAGRNVGARAHRSARLAAERRLSRGRDPCDCCCPERSIMPRLRRSSVRSSLVDTAALAIIVLLGVALAVAMPLMGAAGVLVTGRDHRRGRVDRRGDRLVQLRSGRARGQRHARLRGADAAEPVARLPDRGARASRGREPVRRIRLACAGRTDDARPATLQPHRQRDP